ncbi:hypothetical protein IV203_027382 [Nitzschia inconspicua]|uniref:Uncharacterized protein n=1 Tax=Nitzschia inconspicua TaxID=303405 RepID=A0A9K3LYV6_9STRA|nr:hypothetical protein IV203_027382 [Nitzschia inconspicua]
MEEEKKDQSLEKVEAGEAIKRRDDGAEDDSDFGDYTELPKELRGLKDRTFEFEEELEAELVSRGFEDIPVILDPSTGKARLRMTTGAHNLVTNRYVKKFERIWGGQATAVDGTTNVFIQPAAPGRKIYARQPDIAFWGPDKIVTIMEDGVAITEPKNLAVPLKRHKSRDQVERVNPDVVFLFSWTKADKYEEEAINDMMNRAVVTPTTNPNNSAPRLGYLLKVRLSSKRLEDDRKKLLRMDIYRIPRGATVQDAIARQNGATKQTYTPGGNDVVMTITAQDLGIPIGQPAPPNFTISAETIFISLS